MEASAHIPTFADDRDDEYFESLMAGHTGPSDETLQAWGDRLDRYFEKAEAATREEALRTRQAVQRQFQPHLADGPGLYDEKARQFVAYPADPVDFFPLHESQTPEARVYRGVAWQGKTACTTYDYDSRRKSWTMAELVDELLQTISPTVTFTHRPRGELGGYTTHPDSAAAIDDRLHMDDEEFDFIHRDEDPALVEHRWNRPEDELELLDIIAEEGLEVYNTEILTYFRRVQLHQLCRWYFNTDDYADREIVLKWQEASPGRFVPELKMNIVEWIDSLCEGVADDDFDYRGGSTLSGFYSAAQTLRRKMQRKSRDHRRVMPNDRILTTEQVRAVAHRAVADVSSSAVALYFEL